MGLVLQPAVLGIFNFWGSTLEVRVDWNKLRSMLVVVFEKSGLGEWLRKFGRSELSGRSVSDGRSPLSRLG